MPTDPTAGGLIDGHATGGYWGRDIRSRISAEFVPDKVLALHYQKIQAMGLPYALWREADFVNPNLSSCSCFKDTSKQPDVPCQTCYGTGKIPGYFKFGTVNYWVASIDPIWTLTNTIVDTNNRPNRIMLATTAITGTAVSSDLPVNMAGKLSQWEFKVDGYTRDGGANSSILTEFSINSGATWQTLSVLNLESSGIFTQIRFRITLNRTTVNNKTPMFEIIRFRFANAFDIANLISEPIIRIIPTWLNEAEIKQLYGRKFEANGKRFWTLPLTFFDPTLSKETPTSRLSDDDIVEVRYGGEVGYRYKLIDFSYSDTFGVFTRQEMALRKVAGTPGGIQGEYEYRVF